MNFPLESPDHPLNKLDWLPITVELTNLNETLVLLQKTFFSFYIMFGCLSVLFLLLFAAILFVLVCIFRTQMQILRYYHPAF